MRNDLIAQAALHYHKTVEGEYGCPGLECPGVKRLIVFGQECAALTAQGETAPLAKLAEQQQDLPPDFAKVLHENRWELYEGETAPAPVDERCTCLEFVSDAHVASPPPCPVHSAAASPVPAAHRLKVVAPYFDALLDGSKTFEVRRDDRGGFEVGEVLWLCEWLPNGYSGREVRRRITYVLADAQQFGVAEGYVVLGLAPVAAEGPAAAPVPAAEGKWTANTLRELLDSHCTHTRMHGDDTPCLECAAPSVAAEGLDVETLVQRIRDAKDKQTLLDIADEVDDALAALRAVAEARR